MIEDGSVLDGQMTSVTDSAILAEDTEGNTATMPLGGGPDLADGGLSLPTAELMALGGDARITLDEQSGLNAYGCAPKPMPAISYASSTASTVSSGAFAQARAFHFQLQQDSRCRSVADVYADAMEDARRRLRGLYGLDETTDIAFGPSGTDLEYLALAIALQHGKTVRNIVVEVDEVGSGCLNAQNGRFFAPQTALGLAATTGDPIPGFDPGRIVIDTVTIRNSDGSLRATEERDQALATTLEESLAAGERPLLHTVHRSKTGLVAPSVESLEQLTARFGGSVDIIVDACQGRISPDMVRTYLNLGATVFVTGSKFIGGPPFSAFALVPAAMGEPMREGSTAPEGLGAFFARGEMPAGWRSMDQALPPITNFGLLLRLECGLFELSRLLAYAEEKVTRTIEAFAKAVRELPADAPIQLLSESHDESEQGLHPLDRTMLYTFRIAAPNPVSGKPLDIDEAKSVYTMLYKDMSDHFSDPHEKMIAAEACHVGQPVRCRRSSDGAWEPTLRLSLSAPHITQVAGLDEAALFRRFRTDMDWISSKIRLVLLLLGREQERRS